MNAPLQVTPIAQAIREIRPQPGPQGVFLSSSADIAIYGGAAYAGKTFALLMEPLRHIHDETFRGVIFRRESTQVMNPGGLWDESVPLYKPFGALSVAGKMEHRFPSGAKIEFAHLEHHTSVYGWDGAQVPFIAFDQLEHFEQSQFFYMLSRNRCPSGTVRSYMRATCNPNPDSWLAKFLAWWIDQETGYPIPERAGKIRYFVREGDTFIWGDTAEEVRQESTDPKAMPKSVTFIPGTIYDNEIGMSNDPGYEASLKAMNSVERARLLGGNWKIRPAAGLLFQRGWCTPLPAAPSNLSGIVRYWDLAATKPIEDGKERKPAWTVGVKLARYDNRLFGHTPRFVILDVQRTQDSPANVRRLIKNTAIADGTHVRVGVPQDPGQAGKDQAQQMVGLLAGYDVRSTQESGDKISRFNPFSAQCEVGNVDYVQGSVPEDYLLSLENFPDGVVKDDADATSGAFRDLLKYSPIILNDRAEDQHQPAVTESTSPWQIGDR